MAHFHRLQNCIHIAESKHFENIKILKINNKYNIDIDLLDPFIQYQLNKCSVLFINYVNINKINISPNSIPLCIYQIIICNKYQDISFTNNLFRFPNTVSHFTCYRLNDELCYRLPNSLPILYVNKCNCKYLPNSIQYLYIIEMSNPSNINYLPQQLHEFLISYVKHKHMYINYHNLPAFLYTIAIDIDYIFDLNCLPSLLNSLILIKHHNYSNQLFNLPSKLESIYISINYFEQKSYKTFVYNGQIYNVLDTDAQTYINYDHIYSFIKHNKFLKHIYMNCSDINNVNSKLKTTFCNSDAICNKRKPDGTIIHKCYPQHIIRTVSKSMLIDISKKYRFHSSDSVISNYR